MIPSGFLKFCRSRLYLNRDALWTDISMCDLYTFYLSLTPFLFHIHITISYIRITPDVLYLWEDKIQILLTTLAFIIIIRLHLEPSQIMSRRQLTTTIIIFHLKVCSSSRTWHMMLLNIIGHQHH